uniref:poly-beta-1,6 N-acetyl-D-glucosamine export porin PgaA n=1 Tax=Castellaniella defragrans TaxID=75697 RepID=UPI00333E4D04
MWAASVPGLAYAETPFTPDYDQLIAEARAGRYEPALQMLRRQPVRAGSRATYDHIVIAGWAGKSAEAVAVYEKLPADEELPADVLLTVASSYRDLQRWSDAIGLYRKGAGRYPERPAFTVGEIMALVDAGSADEALRTWLGRAERQPDDPEPQLALAYVYAGNNQPSEALFHADKALALAPNQVNVQRAYVFALSRARLAGSALAYARKHEGLFDGAWMRALEADAAAELVRMALMPSRSESDRFVIADRALARYDELIPAWTQLGAVAEQDVTRARIDRLGALHGRMRMRDLIREYEALVAQGTQVPPYALAGVAEAYLYERQPEKAGDLYREVMQSPNAARASMDERFNQDSGQYYAYQESGRFKDAYTALETANPNYPPWRYYKGLDTGVPNNFYMRSRQLSALASLYADDTPAAQQALEDMVSKGPNNTGLRADLSKAYRIRSLPRAAERELKMAETLTPRGLFVENEQGFTALDLQEWRQAEALSRDTLARSPEDQDARRLAREWAIQNKIELRVHGDGGLTDDNPVSGSGDFAIDTTVYSAPIHYDWRLFAGGGYSTGKFDEGEAHYRWLRAGVERRVRDMTVEAEVSSNAYGHGTKPGLRLSAVYDLSDHWQFGGEGERLSRETPLRALNSNISSNRAQAYVRWRAHERREWTFAVAGSSFSDGNERLDLSLQGSERLYTVPRLKLDAEMWLATQHNRRRDDAPYFNPRSDLMMLPGLRLTHTLRQRYEMTWEQIATAAAGTYSQQGYGAAAAFVLGYGQRFRPNDVLDMDFMVTGTSRPYDGERERELRVVFDLNYRF